MAKGVVYGQGGGKPYIPVWINNDEDVLAITINFGMDIPDLFTADYIDSLRLLYNFIGDNIELKITGWSRINATTIKFHTESFYNITSRLTVTYNSDIGNIGEVPSFIDWFFPTHVVFMGYKLDTLYTSVFTEIDIELSTFTDSFIEMISTNGYIPVELVLTDNFNPTIFTNLSIGTTDFTSGLIEESITAVFV